MVVANGPYLLCSFSHFPPPYIIFKACIIVHSCCPPSQLAIILQSDEELNSTSLSDIMPVVFCALFKVLVITFKSGAKVFEGVLYCESAWSLNIYWEVLLRIPTLIEVCLVANLERAYSVVAQCLWNSFPMKTHPAPFIVIVLKTL